VKIASTIARYLLGFLFVVFGLNGFLHFIPAQMPTGPAGQFMVAIFVSHFSAAIFISQLIPGVLLLINRYIPLALTILAAVIYNIFFFHVFMNPSGLPMAIVVIVLWFLVFASVRSAFDGIFQQRVAD
jgi:putative oxidoreductase